LINHTAWILRLGLRVGPAEPKLLRCARCKEARSSWHCSYR